METTLDVVNSLTEIRTFRNLDVYKIAFELQQSLFDISKQWPRDEVYSLTGQTRRSSRSIGANVSESWAKRRYPAHFLSKLTDADGELQETHHWLATANRCGYLGPTDFSEFENRYDELGAKLGQMIAKYEKFCIY
jgi:four helix bundle protein